MTHRQANLFLKYGTTGLVVLAGAVAVLGFMLPMPPIAAPAASNAAAPAASYAAVSSAGSALKSFEPLFGRQLRVALGAPPANASLSPDSPAESASAPPSLAFVGTVGDSLAMLRSQDGSVAVVAVGELIAGARLVAIRPTQVDMRSGDGEFTLNKTVEAPPDSGMPAATDPPATPTTNFAHGY